MAARRSTHYKIDGHLACGTHGEKLASSKELNQVKCRNCRNTEVYKQARRDTCNAARRATRKSKVAQPRTDWRTSWQQHLTDLPSRNRLPRGFAAQPYV